MKQAMLQSMFVLLLALVASGPAHAQAQTRAYAPENLRTLSVSDQTRVIGLEYSEQSGGRRIPDDQLRFYLDQVSRSNWTFSRIKQDIAQSLGGNGPRPPNPGNGGEVTCESKDNRYRECPANFRGNAVLVQNLSGTRCVEGQNWGSRNGVVWVDRGCRGRFASRGNGGGNGGGTALVKCESPNGAYRECPTGFRGRAVVNRQLSSTRCSENQNWGQRAGVVWVRSGCRAEFRDSGTGWGNGGGGNPNYSVTCSSEDNRRKTCAYDARNGRPILLQQLSNQSCREGYSWGHAGAQVWVDRGCRGRFGPR